MYPGNKRNTPKYKVIPNINEKHITQETSSSISKEISLFHNIDLNETYSYYKYMNNDNDLSNAHIVYDNTTKHTYKYKATEGLNLKINNTNTYDKVVVCAYKIANDGLFPFVQYLLYKENKINTLNFPTFNYISPEHSINYSTILLNKFLFKYNSDSNNYFSNCLYNGSTEYLNNLYLFFDITNCKVNIYDVYSDNKIWFAIMDEIMNHKKLCNFQINSNIYDFFVNNSSFIFIQNAHNQNYELPVIAYVNSKKEKVIFTYTFGVIKTKTNIGDNYVFTNYDNASQNMGVDAYNLTHEPNKTDVTFGIIRFALFLKVSYIPLTSSMVGFNNWEDQYDSISICNLQIENKTFSSVIIIKDYEQQTPLSYHYCKYNELNNSIL
jgi:hypothetical protein